MRSSQCGIISSRAAEHEYRDSNRRIGVGQDDCRDAKLELAVALFSRGRLSMGKAAELADMSVARFQLQLGARQIGPHYGVQDALDDSATLAAFRRAGSSSPIRPH